MPYYFKFWTQDEIYNKLNYIFWSFFLLFSRQRIACHIQVFALSKWLTSILPIEYYEFARGMEWSIPYINLPWETEGVDSLLKDSSFQVLQYSKLSEGYGLNSLNGESESALSGEPLTATEYRAFLEVRDLLFHCPVCFVQYYYSDTSMNLFSFGFHDYRIKIWSPKLNL